MISRDPGMLARIRSSGQYALGVGVHNAFTACLAERAGFDVLWLSSLEVSTSKLLPDINVITFSEVASIVKEIRLATTLPIFVDADNGYGSDDTAFRAAREFGCAGATAICIEDNAFPKRGSFYRGVDRHLEDTDGFCQRIEKVRRAIKDRQEIIARTEALVAGFGAQAAIERARAYIEAGANAVFVQTNKSTLEEFRAVLSEIRTLAPIVITPTALPDVPADELHSLGADVIIYSNVVMRTITRAVNQVLTELKEKQCLSGVHNQITSMEALFELTKAYDWISGSGPQVR